VTVERVRVGDVLTLQRREVAIDPMTEYQLVGVLSFGKGIFHREPTPGAELGDYRFFAIRPGDLVLSNIQAWEGAIGFASERDAGTIGTHRFLSYVPAGGRIDTNWARWFFLSEPGMSLIRQAAPGTTVRNRTLAIDRFEALEIPLPSIDEQRRVAQQLDNVSSGVERLASARTRSSQLASAIPLAICAQLERETQLSWTRLGDVLEFVRDPCDIDPVARYVSMGIRSFGKGIFHYPVRPGAEIGSLRFQSVHSRRLAISNIKAWEGAVATTEESDRSTVASNRFLFFRPIAGGDATDYFWALLLGSDGLAALGHASPGSADRNRTLALDRFQNLRLRLPDLRDQAAIGRRIRRARSAVERLEGCAERAGRRVGALVPAALHEAFASFN
jgi:type I restriction enzyme, S subunit